MKMEKSRDATYDVIRACNVLIGSHVGVEETIEKIATGSYGDISNQFTQARKESERTGDLEGVLRRLGEKTTDERLGTLISILADGVGGRGDTVRSLDELSYREMNRKQEEIDGFIGRLSIMKEIMLVVGILGPIFIFTYIVSRNNMSPPAKYDILAEEVYYIVAFLIISLLSLVIRMKRTEPTID